jgi:hypothetical protein
MDAVLIDLSNYDSALVQSTAGRAGTPDGNVFFNKASGLIEFITKQELATVDLSGGITTGAIQINVVASAGTYTRVSGSFIDDGFVAGRSFAFSAFTNGGNNVTKVAASVTALVITVTDNTGLADETGGGDEVAASVAEANPLDETLGIKLEGSYAFENQERRVDEDLRKYDRWTDGSFKFAGAYNFINSKKPSTSADREIQRGSGWNEYASDGGVDRIYFGNKGLSQIFVGSQPYQQLAVGGVPADFAKVGQIDEAVQVFGDTGNTPSDAGAGDFDTRTYEAVSVRTFGNNYDRKETTTDLGILELGGYSTGFALNESAHLTTGDYTLADVYGGAMVSPWGLVAVPYMELEKLAVALNVDEFAEAAGDFTWVLNNPGSGTNGSPIASGNLYEMVAFLDALAQTDDDIDSGTETVTNGKRVGTWYYYNATGQIVTRSGADALGLYLYNVPVADQQLVVFTDDIGAIKTYSFQVSVEADIGANAKADALAWYHSYFAAAYNTSGAVTVEDSGSVEVKGLASTADGSNKIIFAFDYTGDTLGGPADTDKNCVFICEGDGGVAQAKTLYTITKITTVAFACAPPVENNV